MGGLFSPGGGYKNVNTQVYNASKAVAWGDLDLSAYIGQARRVVLFKIVNGTGVVLQVKFRKNGDADNFDGYGPMFAISIPIAGSSYVLGLTDETGITEWYSSSAAGTITLVLEGYL